MSFDALAPWYGSLERIAFGEQLQGCRIACLDEIPPRQRVLIVGEGNGRFLCELLRRQPAAEVECVDSSARMLQLARSRLQSSETLERVRFLREDITVWSPVPQHYDLIVTHFILDCFPQFQLGGIVRKLAQGATADASWLLADFRVPGNGLERFRACAWLAVMYSFFRLTTGIEASELVDPTPLLQAEGFARARQHLFRHGMLKSELWRRQPGTAQL